MTAELGHAELGFELRFLKCRGTAFQQLFCDLMVAAYPTDFLRVRAHGNSGDYKCDGYLPSRRAVFQVYAPGQMSLRQLLRKARDDFEGALRHWAGRMDRWVFVHNSREGLPPQAVQTFDDLRRSSGAPTIEIWTYEEMLGVFREIAPDRRKELYGLSAAQTDHRDSPRLPGEDLIVQYWGWLAAGNDLRAAGLHASTPVASNVPIRIVASDVAARLAARDEREVAQARSDASAGERAELDSDRSFRPPPEESNLSHILSKHRHLLITGDAGSGKSTLLWRYAMREVQRLLAGPRARWHRQTPVLIDLWRFSPERPLLDLLYGSINRAGVKIDSTATLAALQRGYLVLLCDGLDEVPEDHRRECLAQLTAIVENCPNARLVVTSRPFPTAPHQFAQLAIAPLSDVDIADALGTQFGSASDFCKRFDTHSPQDFVRRRMEPEVRQLCRLPLTLGLVVTLLQSNGRLPDSLFDTYDRFLSLILQWEVQRGTLPSVAGATAALEETAYAMEARADPTSTIVDWQTEAGRAIEELRSLSVISGTNAEDILRAVSSTGIVRVVGDEVSFAHKTFLEFLAARRILRKSPSPTDDPIAANQGVARFLFARIQDAIALLEAQLSRCSDVDEMMPSLDEASRRGCEGGRFEALLAAKEFSDRLAVDLTYFVLGTTPTFGEDIDEMVATCLAFGPKTNSILKVAADGIARANGWESSRVWFENVVAGLETNGWAGAQLHRRFAQSGVFEADDAFFDEQSSVSGADSYFAYLDRVFDDDFAGAEEVLSELEAAVRMVPRHRRRRGRRAPGEGAAGGTSPST